MSDTKKLYFSNSGWVGAVGNASNSGDSAITAIQPGTDISEFADSATRPVRVRQSRSRPDMLCLYQVGHFEHLLEKLGFVFYNNQQRRRDAHFAIETCIRPLVDLENSVDKTARLGKLHALVEQRTFHCSTVPPANHTEYQAPTTHETKGLAFITSRKVGDAILIPNGVSIAAEKASDVIAQKIVRVRYDMLGPGQQARSPVSLCRRDALSGHDDDDHDINALSERIQRQLEEAADASLIVLEIKNENDAVTELKTWEAAYRAAEKVRQDSDGKKSIMLVPSAETFEPKSWDGSIRKTSKEEALQGIQQSLNQSDRTQSKPSTKDNPYACLDEL